MSDGRVQVNMGTLYPGLIRLEQRGFISGTWGVTDNKRHHIRIVQGLLGHADVSTTMIYTHVLERGVLGVASPAEKS